MLQLSFIYPAALWLLLLLFLLWAFTLALPRRVPPGRFWSSLGLRTFLLLALIFSLAGTQLVAKVEKLTTVFLLDSSDSIPASTRSQAETFIQEALKGMPEDDQAALVIFGENALVERIPSPNKGLGQLTSVPIASRTNLQAALQLGLALFPADAQKRLILLSDGGENSGHALEAARLAAARNVPLEIVDLTSKDAKTEALLASLKAPNRARDGQEIELLATVESTLPQKARLKVFADQELVSDQEVALESGSKTFRVKVKAEGQGFQRYRAQIEPQNDNRVQNNEAAALVQVEGPPRVLLLEGKPEEARNLQEALKATNILAEVSPAANAPTDLTGLSAYEAVILVNVPARDLPSKFLTTLPAYVRDLGKGFIMIGGGDSFGVGGYGHTPIEDALPIYMDVRNRQERPNLALVFVIDKSGSMDACHCAGSTVGTSSLAGVVKIDLAKEAVIQASALLGERDTLGVVAFDSSAHWVLPAKRGAKANEVEDAISNVKPQGNTNIRAGLLGAEEALLKTDARVKHALLLTDGWGGGGDNLDLAQKLRDEGITLSVVAAGSGSAKQLESLAETGGGRYYPAEDMREVPEIFLRETLMAAGNYIIENPFTPLLASSSPILNGFEAGFPSLYGYNGSTLKETAQKVLATDDTSPLLAQWNYGLGRSIAWTSDAKGKWAKDWVRWAGFPRFVAQMVGWVLPTQGEKGITSDLQVEGSQTVIAATVLDAAGKPLDNLQLNASLIDNRQGDAKTLQEVSLTQVAPGEYRTRIPSPAPGSYLVQLQGQQKGKVVIQDLAGLVVPYSSEYRQNQSNPALLAELARLTKGRVLTKPAEAFAHNLAAVTQAQEIGLPLLILALLLFPFDIAIRRLLFRHRDFAEAQAWFQAHLPHRLATVPAAPDPTLARLAQAKQRATSPPKKPKLVPKAEDVVTSPQPSVPTPQQKVIEPKAAPSTTDLDPLARLREAKERARRRARGEE